jgi:uncharacterized HAD superfamily protein
MPVGEPALSGRYITMSAMAEDCKKYLIPKIAILNLKGVAGVPRSGAFPASVCSMMLNLPLYNFSTDSGFHRAVSVTDDGGRRMKNYTPNGEKILLLDDTYGTGESMKIVKKAIDRDDILYGSLYIHPEKLNDVDVYGTTLEYPHLLEWNLFNCGYIKRSYIDFDGILCPNVPYSIAIDEEKYIEYITSVEPYYDRLPKLFKCKGIITARLEKYRDITEGWLKKYKVNYGELIMYPTEKEKLRDSNHVVEAAKFKSKIYGSSNAKIYIESEKAEAEQIRNLTKKTVICPQEERFA